MVKLFTLLFSHNSNKAGQEKPQKRVEYAPSSQSVKTILDFSKAYEPLELKNCEEKDIILN